jgi:hypothetical protein
MDAGVTGKLTLFGNLSPPPRNTARKIKKSNNLKIDLNFFTLIALIAAEGSTLFLT